MSKSGQNQQVQDRAFQKYKTDILIGYVVVVGFTYRSPFLLYLPYTTIDALIMFIFQHFLTCLNYFRF